MPGYVVLGALDCLWCTGLISLFGTRLLRNHHCLLACSNCRDVRLVLTGSMPTYRWKGKVNGGYVPSLLGAGPGAYLCRVLRLLIPSEELTPLVPLVYDLALGFPAVVLRCCLSQSHPHFALNRSPLRARVLTTSSSSGAISPCLIVSLYYYRSIVFTVAL